jgi:hypothetical protein
MPTSLGKLAGGKKIPHPSHQNPILASLQPVKTKQSNLLQDITNNHPAILRNGIITFFFGQASQNVRDYSFCRIWHRSEQWDNIQLLLAAAKQVPVAIHDRLIAADGHLDAADFQQ